MSGFNVRNANIATTFSSSALGSVGSSVITDMIIGNLGTFFPGGFSGGGASGGTGGGTGAVPTAPPPIAGASPLDLQLLVATLPFAEEGAVIRPEYHNSVVQVLQLMARLMGVGPVSGDLILNVAPSFQTISDSDTTQPGWVVGKGTAVRSALASAVGWTPITLPSGARIKQITVRGRRAGTVASCTVRVERQALATGDISTVVEAQLNNVTGDPFEKVALPTGPTLEAIDEARTVDNSTYTYLLSAELLGAATAPTPAVVELFPVQIAYGLE